MAFELNVNKLIINPFYSRILVVWLKLMLKVVDRTCYICRFEKNIKQCCLPRCSVQRHLFMPRSTKSLVMTVFLICGSKPSDRMDFMTGFATVCKFPNQWKKYVCKFAQCCCSDLVVLRLVDEVMGLIYGCDWPLSWRRLCFLPSIVECTTKANGSILTMSRHCKL